jgi:hypothetical protein
MARRPSTQTIAMLTAFAADPSDRRYGYELGQEVGLKAGSLYPILIRLTDRGLLDATREPTRHPADRPGTCTDCPPRAPDSPPRSPPSSPPDRGRSDPNHGEHGDPPRPGRAGPGRRAAPAARRPSGLGPGITALRHPTRTAVHTRTTYGAGVVTFAPDLATIAGTAPDGTNTVAIWHIN